MPLCPSNLLQLVPRQHPSRNIHTTLHSTPLQTTPATTVHSTPLHSKRPRVTRHRQQSRSQMAASSPSAAAAVHGAMRALLPVILPPSSSPAVPRRTPGGAASLSVGAPRRRRQRGAAVVAAALGDLRPAIDEYPEGILSGEWPDNFSLVSYEDLRTYLESQIISTDKMSPTAKLGEVMSRPVQVATADQKLAEIDAFFATQSGMPVLDNEGRCIGVVSKKDKAKASNGLDSTIGEVMSSPAITLTPEKTVLEAAALMLKHKVHRIPVVNEQQQVIGIVTRTDVFQALEANKA